MMNDSTEWDPDKPGAFGTLDVCRRRRLRPTRFVCVRDFVIAVIVIVALVGALIYLAFISGWTVGISGFVFLVAYLLAAFYLHPRPNDDRLNFTWTDKSFPSEVNQMLAFFWLLLLPGRYVTESIFIFFAWHKLPTVTDLTTKEISGQPGTTDLFR